jgi:hypothetical protein
LLKYSESLTEFEDYLESYLQLWAMKIKTVNK